jgi:hypothetical protein
MNVLQEAETLLAKMTQAEKAQVLQWVARDLEPILKLPRALKNKRENGSPEGF